jgi:HK97 family phage prohead protease
MIEFQAVPITLDASAGEDSPRTITGVAVPWDTAATVSSGEKVAFKRGAFDLNAKAPKLLENHDMTQLRGVVVELADDDAGLLFTAKFANTKASDEAIELVKAGAYDSVSVGAVPIKFKYDKQGVMVVSQANLVEISLVAQPAFADAVITEIAASEPDAEPIAASPEADEPQPDNIPEEEIMSQDTPTVEASAEIVPTAPLFAAARREVKLPTAVEYIAAAIAGGDQWRAMSEALKAAAPDIVTNDTPGILPTPIISPVYNNFIGRRPVVDAVGVRALPAGGKVFIRPEVTTHTSIGASIAEQSPTAGTMVVFNNQVTKQIFGGFVNISEADIDWSDPAILSVVLDDMGRIYANATDNYAADTLVAGASVTSNFSAGSLVDPSAWAAWTAGAAATILSSSNGNLPSHLFLSPDVWQFLLGLSDTSDRPLFPQVGPMNAFGNLAPGQYNGNAFGLQVVVDRNFAASTLIIGDASGYELFEQQKGAMSIESPSTLSRTLAFRGYFAALMIDPTKFVKAVFN